MTNREKFMMGLQSMTDEELADMLSENNNYAKCPATNFCDSYGPECCEKILCTWLKQEASK